MTIIVYIMTVTGNRTDPSQGYSPSTPPPTNMEVDNSPRFGKGNESFQWSIVHGGRANPGKKWNLPGMVMPLVGWQTCLMKGGERWCITGPLAFGPPHAGHEVGQVGLFR